MPRASFGIWQKIRLVELLKIIKKYNRNNKHGVNIKLFFIQGEVVNLELYNNRFIKIKSSKKFNLFSPNINFIKKDISFNSKNIELTDQLFSSYCTVSLGLNPPKKYCDEKTLKNNNYIWDYYSEGSSKNLIDIIYKKSKFIEKNRTINILFIGFKAGLLESLPELNQLIIKKKLKIKLTAISPTLETLQKATNAFTNYRFKYLIKKNINNIQKASEIINLINLEFTYALTIKSSKYDVWTKILKENILKKLINNLNLKEKNTYNSKYFSKLRNITRFTYPYPLEIKDEMVLNGSLNIIKDRVIDVIFENKKFKIKTSEKNLKQI